MRPVKHIEIKENEVRTIYLELDKCAGQIRMSGSDTIAKNNKWVPIKREETSIYLNKYKSTSLAIKRAQFPLVLSWACTIHKVQGLSLTSAVLSFGLEKQKSFNEGQMYVSRATSIDIFLIGKYNRNVLKMNESALIEYSRLRQNRNRHAAEISRARRLTENNILCLTESQIANDTEVAEIKEQLSTFEIQFNSCGVRDQNLTFSLGQNIVLSQHETFPGMSVIDTTKNSFSQNTIWIMLVYSSPSSSLTTFFNTLKNLLRDHHIIDIVLGVFSIYMSFLIIHCE